MVAEHVEKMQERSDELREKLSPGAYAAKQARMVGVQLAASFGGGAVGYFLGNIGKKRVALPTLIRDLVPARNEGMSDGTVPKKWLGAALGYFVGTSIATIVLGYEHWSKGEAQRLAVDEINRDMAESKLRMNPELQRENTLLRDMIAQQDAQLKARGEQPKPQVSAQDASREATVAPAPEKEIA